MYMEIVYEVVMQNAGRFRNAFFQTLERANAYYHEWESINWSGDVYRREIEV